MSDIESLKSLVLAPYIIKASALIGIKRKIGGNQWRHAFATLGILLDYKYYHNHILLKAALLHDLIEDYEEFDINELMNIDHDSVHVIDLVLLVTRRSNETKSEYLQRILNSNSPNSLNSWILKCADRISNLTDLQLGFFTEHKIAQYLDETEEYIIPMARKANQNHMLFELNDLIDKRRRLISKMP
jgi:(p)ppGpp synthase/HD superfamily hydrolase